MTQIDYKDTDALQALTSAEFGEWCNTVLVDQDMINQYAQLSGDDMWLHVDVISYGAQFGQIPQTPQTQR